MRPAFGSHAVYRTCSGPCEPDSRCRAYLVQGNPRGSGIWNGEGMGRGRKVGDQFTSNLGSRWTGSYDAKEGFQVSKREVGFEKKGISKESKNKGFVP
jgi:hypothetical protein